MKIEAIPIGPFQSICYLVWDTPTQALVVDPGDDAERILQALDQHGLNVAAYLCTHGHPDHISALGELWRQRPAPTALHSADAVWAFSPINQLAPYYSIPEAPGETIIAIEKADLGQFNGPSFQVIETPGHSPGSCCFYFPEADVLLSGDTLFCGSCGRTDLPGGNAHEMKKSLQRLKQLPEQTRVFPGHGPSTTIGDERRSNFFMQ